MGRCSEDVFKKISGKNIKSHSNFEIDFTVQDELPSCKLVPTRTTYSVDSGVTAYYDRFEIPENAFECNRQGCVNTGTLEVTIPQGVSTATGVTYHANYDAIEWHGGVVTMYVKITEDTDIEVMFSNDSECTNADKYSFSLKYADRDDNGFVPVVIDLLSENVTDVGNGWTPSMAGAYIKVGAKIGFGVSTIMLYDELEDFDINDVIKIGCVQSIDGNNSLDVIEKQCAAAQYSNDISGIEITLQGNTATPNYWKLNPRLKSVSDYIGSINNTVEKTVEPETVGSEIVYGSILIPEAYNLECGYYGAQLAGDGCSVTEDTLIRNNLPTVCDVDLKHFQVIKQENGVKFIFNKNYVGKNILVSYPKQVEIERQVATKDAVGSRKVTARYVKETSDGEKYVYTYPNVFVTQFPENVNNSDESTFEFTINAQPDLNGNYYTRDRIVG